MVAPPLGSRCSRVPVAWKAPASGPSVECDAVVGSTAWTNDRDCSRGTERTEEGRHDKTAASKLTVVGGLANESESICQTTVEGRGEIVVGVPVHPGAVCGTTQECGGSLRAAMAPAPFLRAAQFRVPMPQATEPRCVFIKDVLSCWIIDTRT